MRAISILLLQGIVCVPSLSYAANLLFKSNFGEGVALSPVYGFNKNTAKQDIVGTDRETGFSWPITAFGATFSGIHLIAIEPIHPANVNDHIRNVIRSVPGPKGAAVNELFQHVKVKELIGKSTAQAPLEMIRPWNIGDINEAYITYWFKYPADFPGKLVSTVPAGYWRAQFTFKTGGLNNTYVGDYRFMISVMKGRDEKLFWRAIGDNRANNTDNRLIYWSEDNKMVPVPIDQWFKFEVYWKRSGGSDGRFWAAVDGRIIVDRRGANLGQNQLPVTRIMITNPYSGGKAGMESHSTGLEIWDGFPCGDGISCFNR